MSVRRFGPVLGAGVQVSEDEPEQQIVPAPLGVTVMLGEFEKGLVGGPQFLSGRKDLDRRNGGLIESGDAPQCARDFYKLGRGSGELISYRITGGDEVAAALNLYTRQGILTTGAAAASKAFVLGGNVGPWTLFDGGVLTGSVDRAANETLTIAALAATVQNGADETFALADGQSLTLKIDRGVVQTIIFYTAEFANIALATAEEVAAVISAKIVGAQVSVTGAGKRVTLTSDLKGLDSYIEITGGTANAALLFAVAETATTISNVDNVAAVTATELKALIEAAWVNSAGVTVSSLAGALRIETNLAGSTGYIQVIAASDLDTALGLDNVEHQGSDGTAVMGSGRKLLGALTAKNGGRWAGRRRQYVDDHAGAGDITATTLDTGDTMVENEWAGGTLQLKKVTTKTYRILGNTSAGVVSVEGDQDLLTDWTAGVGTPANRYVLTRENLDHLGNDQNLAAEIIEGEENPSTEFGIVLYEDGAEVKRWKNLSTNSAAKNYWVQIVNRDSSNFWVVASDVYVGDKTVAAVRPANYYGKSIALTTTRLTLPAPDPVVNSPTGANPAIVMGAWGSSIRSQILTGTVENAGADIRWTTSIGPVEIVTTAFTGVPKTLGDEFLTLTITNGGTVLANGDTIVITILVLEPDELVGGKVWPDVVNEPTMGFTISGNGRTYVDVRAGLDLTNSGAIAAGEVFQLTYPQQFTRGSDSSAVTDADYLLALDPVLSPLNKIFGKNKGLVKIATPGLASTVVTKAGLEYAAARNYMFRVEFPANVITEDAAITYINSTIGRSEYGVCHLPSFGFVLDPSVVPSAENVPLKQVPLIGMILGREALVAYQFEGYHKAPAGIDVTLPDVLELTTGDPETATELNEEMTNPQGINLAKFRQGSCIVWGDRTISPTSAWKFHHQRAQMSHYENILRENFDWIVFAINDVRAQKRAETALRGYFYPEWTKGALRGERFADAFTLKIDEEINTDATAAAGDLMAEMKLRLADTIERFKMLIGKAGIFDAVE